MGDNRTNALGNTHDGDGHGTICRQAIRKTTATAPSVGLRSASHNRFESTTKSHTPGRVGRSSSLYELQWNRTSLVYHLRRARLVRLPRLQRTYQETL